jgi:ribosomal protein S18 acetylase RimI-like enzyme
MGDPSDPRPGGSSLAIREIAPADRAWLESLLVAHWGSTVLVSRGRPHAAETLSGLIAELAGERLGVLLHVLDPHRDPASERPADSPPSLELEVVLLHTLVEHRGIGSALLAAAERMARTRGARRIWLVTTNDNQPAIDFYTRRGYRLVATHAGAVTAARALKPEIPECGKGGIPITDELEFERRL